MNNLTTCKCPLHLVGSNGEMGFKFFDILPHESISLKVYY